jgi:hypothetical protein
VQRPFAANSGTSLAQSERTRTGPKRRPFPGTGVRADGCSKSSGKFVSRVLQSRRKRSGNEQEHDLSLGRRNQAVAPELDSPDLSTSDASALRRSNASLFKKEIGRQRVCLWRGRRRRHDDLVVAQRRRARSDHRTLLTSTLRARRERWRFPVGASPTRRHTPAMSGRRRPRLLTSARPGPPGRGGSDTPVNSQVNAVRADRSDGGAP